jgi:double-stranded uracil-DNA glycosylase
VTTRDRSPRGLPDRLAVPTRILFVGINPGLTSARVRHHFAGPSNRFWRLLFDSGLTPERLRPEDDHRLVTWGYGLTNLVPRATAGIDTLRREEFVAGLPALRRKVARLEPHIVALVGVTLFRVVFAIPSGASVTLGLQRERLSGSRVFVLPNPSGRNAHFSYAAMVQAFSQLAALARAGGPGSPPTPACD